jgi:hypothetical protein
MLLRKKRNIIYHIAYTLAAVSAVVMMMGCVACGAAAAVTFTVVGNRSC